MLKENVEIRSDIEQLRLWCHGEWYLTSNMDRPVEELAIDTRKLAQPEEALFIAIKTNRRNGHDFIGNAYEKGVRCFLVSEKVDTTPYKSANIILVDDTVHALQQIIIAKRKLLDLQVIGITGSNGKTIVKEWLYQLLSDSYKAVRSPKSYNSQLGVPLSVSLVNAEHEVGIFEAGISQPGEMEKLEKMIQPNIGVFTNIGEAHSEGFLNNRQKINEKLVLFRHAEHLIYCKDYLELNQCIVQYLGQIKGSNGDKGDMQLFTWSYKSEANLRVTNVKKDKQQSEITAEYDGREVSIQIPFSDPASIENAIHCWCVLLLMGFDDETVNERMLKLHSVKMRLELRHGINDCTIINDTYNSDLTSLIIALDYLEQQKQHTHHTVILSDMLQIARSDSELYEEVAEMLTRMNVNRFIGIGPALYKNKAYFRKSKKLRSIFFKSTDDFLKNFHLITFEHEAILLKGARTFAFEKIASLLEQKIHQTVLSINLSALTHNLNVYRSKLKSGTQTMAMVKAFSYGSGSYEVASLLQYSGVDYLSVAYTDEGVSLRKAGITLPIMVMSPDFGSFDRMIAWKLEPELYSKRSLDAFITMATTLQVQDYPVHIKLDTGMHRLGFQQQDIESLVQDINGHHVIKVASVFSHLAASEDNVHDDFTLRQAKVFKEMYEQLIAGIGYRPLRHLCNSAGVVRHPELHFDMVRLGIGLYGVDSSSTISDQLKQVSSLKTTIAQIKEIGAEESVGYGRRYVSKQPRKIATISIGYADGYPRALGNEVAYVLVRGVEARVVGSVCMDMCMIDVTDVPEVAEGDEVILTGPELPMTVLAKWANTIPYEMMTSISQRVKRVYENEV